MTVTPEGEETKKGKGGVYNDYVCMAAVRERL